MSDTKHALPAEDMLSPNAGGPGLMTILWRRKALVILGAIFGVVLGGIFYFQQPPRFQSSADMAVFKRRIDPVTSFGTGVRDARNDVVDDYVGSQAPLMRSRTVLLQAASILDKNRAEMRNLPNVPPDGLVGYIQAGLIISRPKDPTASANSVGNIINVAWRGANPEDCPKVVEAVITGYQKFLGGQVNQTHEEEIRQIKLLLEQNRKDRASVEKTLGILQEDIQKHGAVSLNEITSRIALFETRLVDLKEKLIEIDSRLSQIQKGIAEKKDSRLLMVLFQLTSNKPDSPARPIPEAAKSSDDALFNLRLQEEELLQDFGPDHPKVAALRKRMAAVRDYFDRHGQPGQSLGESPTSTDELIRLYVQVLEEDKRKLEETQKNIRDALDADHNTVRETNSMVVQERRLQNQVLDLERSRSDHEKSLATLQVQRDMPLFEAPTINPAGPGFKVAPVLSSSIAFGAMLGLVGGFVLAFLAELSDQSFRSPDEIRRRLGVPVIGHVPPLVAHEATDEAQKRLDPLLTVHHRPKSADAEAFRGIRTSLYFSSVGKGHQLIQVTSPNPGDGKSTAAANLAAVIAQSGKRVVLIDCDFRKPRVHKIFGLESSEVGLTSVLLGECDFKGAMQRCAVPGLDLLPCGPRPSNPAELLSSEPFRNFLDAIREAYDFVIIDTPPLLAVSDPAAVATQVDGVILVARLSKTARPAAQRARDILGSMGAKLLGVLVNDCDNLAAGYDSYDGYGYGYNYTYSYTYRYADEYADDDAAGEKSDAPRKSR